MTDFTITKQIELRVNLGGSQLDIPKKQLVEYKLEEMKDTCIFGVYCVKITPIDVGYVKFFGVDQEPYIDVRCELTGKVYSNNTIITVKVESIQNTQKGFTIKVSNDYCDGLLYKNIKSLQMNDTIPVIVRNSLCKGNKIKVHLDLPYRWTLPAMGVRGANVEVDDKLFTQYDELISNTIKSADKKTVDYVNKLLGVKTLKFKVDVSGNSIQELGFLSGIGPVAGDKKFSRIIGREEAYQVAINLYKMQSESYCSLLKLDIKSIDNVWQTKSLNQKKS